MSELVDYKNFVMGRRNGPLVLPKTISVFADFGNCLWVMPSDFDFLELIPDEVLEGLDAWLFDYWETKDDYRYQTHGLNRKQYNEIGRALALKLKACVPSVEVTYAYWTADFTDDGNVPIDSEDIGLKAND